VTARRTYEGAWFTSTNTTGRPVAHAVWLVDAGNGITYCNLVEQLDLLRKRTTGDLTCPDCWVAFSGAKPFEDAS
jgi:hypothetical protein